MKENLSKKSWSFDPTQNFVKCPKLVREAPRAIQKIQKKICPKGPGPNLGPGSLYIPCVTPDAPPWRPLCYGVVGQAAQYSLHGQTG